jgi:glycosyltransferase involved in cell wall biosynthesis
MDIVIVTYNSEKWIKRCLDSLLKAKALSSDLKLFFVDNHSSDQTVELLTAYEKKDDFSRFEIIQQEQNQGFGNANNLGASFGKDEIVEQLVACDTQFVKNIPVIGIHRRLYRFIGYHLLAATVKRTADRGSPLARDTAVDEQFLGGGIVDETQSDTAFFRCIVDNLLRAYLSKRAARDTHGNAFQQGRLAGPVRLLGLIVPVIAENQCRHALPQHVGQRTEGAEIFGFYRL